MQLTGGKTEAMEKDEQALLTPTSHGAGVRIVERGKRGKTHKQKQKKLSVEKKLEACVAVKLE